MTGNLHTVDSGVLYKEKAAEVTARPNMRMCGGGFFSQCTDSSKYGRNYDSAQIAILESQSTLRTSNFNDAHFIMPCQLVHRQDQDYTCILGQKSAERLLLDSTCTRAIIFGLEQYVLPFFTAHRQLATS